MTNIYIYIYSMKIFNIFKNPKKRGVYIAPKSEIFKSLSFAQEVSSDTATTLSAVYRAILLRSENIASLPKSVKKRNKQGWDSTNHPVNKLFHFPNNYTNGFDFWNSIVINLDSRGNAYAIIKRDDSANPISLHLVKNQNVKIYIGENTKRFEVRNEGWLNGSYSNEDVLHFMTYSTDGIIGINPILHNSTTFARALACRKFSQEFFEKGGHIKGVLEMENSLDDSVYEKFLEKFQASKNYDTPLLEYGIKYKNIGITPVTAQLLSTEEFTIQDISRVFGVPTPFLSELSRATFSNIEQQNIWFTQYSLRPTCKRIEVEMENKLFFEKERGKYSINFNLSGLLRGDAKSRAEYYSKMIQNGVYTRADVRDLEGLPFIEGTDKLVFQANLIEDLKEQEDDI